MNLYKENIFEPTFIDISPVEATVTEPVDLDTMKAYMRIDFTDDDTIITGLIKSCRAAVEKFCHISIVEKTITMIAVWGSEWQLPYGPVKSITSVHTRSNNAYTAQVLDTDYFVDGALFKTLSVGCGGRVKVVYIAGHTTVPEDLVLDIKRVIAYVYEHRGDEALTTLQGGTERPKSLGEALELFAAKHRKIWA